MRNLMDFEASSSLMKNIFLLKMRSYQILKASDHQKNVSLRIYRLSVKSSFHIEDFESLLWANEGGPIWEMNHLRWLCPLQSAIRISMTQNLQCEKSSKWNDNRSINLASELFWSDFDTTQMVSLLKNEFFVEKCLKWT